jgi:hypothetical protein
MTHASIRTDYKRAIEEMDELIELQGILEDASTHINDLMDHYRKAGVRVSLPM